MAARTYPPTKPRVVSALKGLDFEQTNDESANTAALSHPGGARAEVDQVSALLVRSSDGSGRRFDFRTYNLEEIIAQARERL
jgi:hypothetical protein